MAKNRKQSVNTKPNRKNTSNKKKKKDEELLFRDGKLHTDEEMELFFSSRKTIKELVAPLGINPNPLEYMIVEDNGVSLYTMCFYIHSLPRMSHFASTYSGLLNTPGVTSSIFINPMTEGKSSSQLDKRIVVLDAESLSAEKEGDRNRYRKIAAKLHDAERYAQDVESGDNQLYEVAFLFTVQAPSIEDLQVKASEMHMSAKEKGIELHSCYSTHPEAFLSGYPTNKVFVASHGLVKSTPVRWHTLDKNSLADIFNHTRTGFSHKDGILAGRNLQTGQPILFDVYDKSHDGYGLIICGKTGTGKSATVKMYGSRYIDFGYVIRSIDFESRGSRGEYSIMADAVGGVNFQIKANSENVLNLFEIDVEDEFDEISGKEYKVLNLSEKMVDIVNIIMIMIKNGNVIERFEDAAIMERIVTDAVAQLYAERGIIDNEPDSLFTNSQMLQNGVISSGLVKKALPTITDFFKKILINQKKNESPYYEQPYCLILATMRDYVRELYYCPECLTFYTREEYEHLGINEDGNRICMHCGGGAEVESIRGVKSYYDGQTTVKPDASTPHINIDISQQPEKDRPISMLIALNYLQVNYIKKNSANPKMAKKMIVLIDELHKTFPYPEARQFVSDVYRTARKRNVSPWTATQALADFKGYKETEAIIKNSTSILLLKQDYQDRDFLKQATPLTDSQIDQVVSLGGDPNDSAESSSRKGEICLIDNNNKVVFIKVDYLTDSESRIVETDISKIQSMYKGSSEVRIV